MREGTLASSWKSSMVLPEKNWIGNAGPYTVRRRFSGGSLDSGVPADLGFLLLVLGARLRASLGAPVGVTSNFTLFAE